MECFRCKRTITPEWLVKKGIDSVSANIDAVSKIRRIVYKTEKRI